MTVRVAIAGASGYAGGELARLLAQHPEFEVTTLCAHSAVGESVASVHPHLVDYAHLRFQETSLEILGGHDVVALALPHGHSGALGAQLRESGSQRLLVDLGADHRLEDPREWDTFYSGEFSEPFVYGMPELARAQGPSSRELISEASALAIPGCNATAVTLALAPLLAAGMIEPRDLGAQLAVGSSGAGRSTRSDLAGSELFGSAYAYSLGGTHRHIPEIRQNLAHASGQETTLSLSAVMVPMSRGILATCSGIRTSEYSASDIHQALWEAYESEACVTVRPLGTLPKTGEVVGSNTLALGVGVDEATNRAFVVAAVDNLVKGTAGACVQSMNLVWGFPETLGLSLNGVAP